MNCIYFIRYKNNRQKLVNKINKSKYNVSFFKTKCNEIQQLLQKKSPINSVVDDYIQIKNKIDELFDKFCAFIEERQKVEIAITNISNVLYIFRNNY